MELLLNLCWLLLAVPAFWVWRRQRRSPRAKGVVCLLALGCVLVLLFPVISESDDLHAMHQEMEESSAKVKAGEGDRSSHLSPNLPVLAVPAAVQAVRPGEIVVGFVDACASLNLLTRANAQTRDRAPPFLLA